MYIQTSVNETSYLKNASLYVIYINILIFNSYFYILLKITDHDCYALVFANDVKSSTTASAVGESDTGQEHK